MLAVKKVMELMQFNKGKYEAAVALKEDRPQLPSNGWMTENVFAQLRGR